MKKFIKVLLLISSITSYVLALYAPAFYYDDTESWSGISALLTGWLGVFFGYISWLANPLFLASWVCILLKESTLVISSSALGCILCLSFLFHKEVVINEAGGTGIISGMGEGFWLWFASLLLMLIYGLLYRSDNRI
jgi:hypothetical protein